MKIKKEKIKIEKQNGLIYLAAFLLAEIIMVYILKKNSFYPFGTKSMLIMDMKNQYVEFLASLRNIISGEDSIFFSWSRSMGGNYIGVFAYYIASSLSFFTLLFPVSKMPIAVEVITVLKIGLCSLTFAIYAKYMTDKFNGKWKSFILIPSICYAFMSYTMVYSLSIMWLDAVILLPLILMGLEKIFDGRKGLQYIIFLTMLFISNYYTGYMVALFTGIYFIIRIISEYTKQRKKENINILVRFFITSILSAAMAAPILISALKDLMAGKLSDVYTGYEPQTSTNFDFKMFFTKFLHGKYDSITNSGLPAVYCGVVMLVFACIYLCLKQIKIREKTGMLLLLALFVASFYFVKLDKVWHGFQYPNWFPYRYAFLFSFVIIYMALRAMIVISSKGYKNDNKVLRNAVTVTLLFAVSIEMGTNGATVITGLSNEFGYGEMSEYDNFINKTQPLVENIKKKDKGLYRINQRYDYSKNDAMLLGYHGMTHYSSTFNANINNLIPKLGLGQSYFWNSGYSSTPLTDSLFGCKYTISDERMPQSCYKLLNSTSEGGSSYENSMALPFMYATNKEAETPDISQNDIFVNQDNYFAGITGEDRKYYTNCEFTTTQDTAYSWSYSIKAVSENPMYLYMQSNASYAEVYVNGEYLNCYFTEQKKGALYLGDFKKDDIVNVSVVTSDDGNTYSPVFTSIVQLDVSGLNGKLSELQQGGIQVNKISGNRLSGEITLTEGQSEIMTSIPYDEGWTICIDGKKINYTKYADTFIQISCSEGKHTISMHYVSPGFYIGLFIGVIGLILTIIYMTDCKKYILLFLGRWK